LRTLELHITVSYVGHALQTCRMCFELVMLSLQTLCTSTDKITSEQFLPHEAK